MIEMSNKNEYIDADRFYLFRKLFSYIGSVTKLANKVKINIKAVNYIELQFPTTLSSA